MKPLKTQKPMNVSVTRTAATPRRYTEAVGRRKTSIARARVYAGHDAGRSIEVNGSPFTNYFPLKKHQTIVSGALDAISRKGIASTVHVRGGGKSAQAEAVRLALARALVAIDPSLRGTIKAFGYLTRDPRAVERKKPGLRKARRPQQWRKR